MHVLGEIVRHGQLLGGLVHLVVAQRGEFADLLGHRAHMAHGLDHVTGARLTLRTDHRSALLNAAQRLAEVLRAAHERHVEFALVDVVDVIRGGEHLRLVDVINLNGLQNTRLGNVADTHLRHHRNRHGLLNALDHRRVAHTAYATGGADVSRNALQRHDGARAGIFGNACLLGCGHIHDHTALEHLRQVPVEFVASGFHESLPSLCFRVNTTISTRTRISRETVPIVNAGGSKTLGNTQDCCLRTCAFTLCVWHDDSSANTE